MTKEFLVEQVEIATKIHELLKPIPFYERYLVNSMVEQLSRADQQAGNMSEKAAYNTAGYASQTPPPPPLMSNDFIASGGEI